MNLNLIAVNTFCQQTVRDCGGIKLQQKWRGCKLVRQTIGQLNSVSDAGTEQPKEKIYLFLFL
jgi:hypothetical protein